MIKAVIFDMDGLLIDSEPFWQESENLVFNSLGINTNKEMFEIFMGKRIDEVVDAMWEIQNWNHKSKTEVVDAIVNNVIKLVNEKGKALTGVYNVLENLKQSTIKIGLASSSKMNIIEAVLDKLNIREYFEVVHSAEYEEYGKPHPQIFISTAKMLGVNPNECLVFEDSLNGVISALAANMKCFAIPESAALNLRKFIIANKILNNLNEFKLTDLESL
ncbi:hexitol phosphatase HxpB [Marinifilum sp. D737]|uniref:hexitol phosphatase HxpB n=1 Tax=Marinifilum sp. D737 TaxID=2969628 RepID=UPI00227368AC|nr:hexitol phosphatase HxpB [Marinifilum sp. D737]MCY1632830.1 hexitol phosphatase HxpB [Marinifilum sp. D737]